MKNNKGMTLIEVILAIFLIGLIASSFFPSMMTSFAIMGKGKAMTENTFKTQQNIEITMEEVRDQIDESIIDPTNSVDPRSDTVTAFGKTIIGKSVEEPIVEGNSYIYSFVGSGHIVEENLPKVSSVDLDQYSPTNVKSPKYLYGANPLIKLKGDHKMESMINYFVDLKKWYISNEGFDGFIPEIVTNESDWGTRYPSWPSDYVSINDNIENILTMKENYIGRYIVYSVIPVSKTGKYGVEIGSVPVYVNGPPILTDLSLHLDTFILEESDGEDVDELLDISGNDRHAKSTGVEVTINYDNGRFAEFKGATLILDKNIPKTEDITLFIVMNKTTSIDSNKNQEIINKSNNNNGWIFRLNEGKLEFFTKKESRSAKSNYDLNSDIHIVTIKATRKNIGMIIDKNNNKEIINESTETNTSINNFNIIPKVGNNNSDFNIAEVIFYASELSDDNINKIREYLSKKHRVELQP